MGKILKHIMGGLIMPTRGIVEDRTRSSRCCNTCDRVAVKKNIGYICWECIKTVPDHIPDAQIENYLKKKNKTNYDYI